MVHFLEAAKGVNSQEIGKKIRQNQKNLMKTILLQVKKCVKSMHRIKKKMKVTKSPGKKMVQKKTGY